MKGAFCIGSCQTAARHSNHHCLFNTDGRMPGKMPANAC
jgi:hypothetical protein